MADFDDLDNELDSFDDFDVDNIDGANKQNKDRKPVVAAASKAIAGVKDNIKSDGVLNNVNKVVEGALPSLIGDKHTSDLSELKDSVIEGADDFKEAVQKNTKPLLKNVKSVLPKDGFFSGIVDKVAGAIGVDLDSSNSSNRGPSEDEIISSDIANTFGAVAGRLAETQAKMAEVSANVSDESLRRTLNAQKAIFDTMVFGVNTSSVYYKKSLELSYKQLFELKRIVKNQMSLSSIQNEKLDAIVKNTGLPDAIKLRTSEAIKRQFQANFGENLYGRFVQNNEWISDAKKNITKRFKNFKTSFVDALIMGNEGIEGYKEIKDSTDSSDLLDPDFMTQQEMDALSREGMAASQLTDYGKSVFGRFIGGKLSKTKMGKAIKHKLDQISSNPYQYAVDKSKTEDGVFGAIAGFAAKLLKPNLQYTNIKLNNKFKSPSDIAEWDGRSYMTLNNIIPGYLGKMLNELMVLNKKKPTDEKFDYRKGEFRSTTTITKDLRNELVEQYDAQNVSLRFSNLVNQLEKESGIKLSKKEKRKFIKAIANHDGKLDTDNIEKQIENSRFTKGLSEKDKLKFVSVIKNAGHEVKYVDGKPVIDTEKRFEINSMLSSVASTKRDARKIIERLIEDGFKDPLIKSGLINYDKRDKSYTINYEAYNDFNISAMMKSFDGGKIHVDKKDIQRYKDASDAKESIDTIKNKTKEVWNNAKEVTGTFIKDKKIDVYFKDKYNTVKSTADDIYKGLLGKVEDTEVYKNVESYLDSNLKPLKEEYIQLKGKLKTAKDEDKLTIEETLKHVGKSIKKIEDEKKYYVNLKKKAKSVKDYASKADAFSVENDVINIFGKVKKGTIDVVKDREIDIMFKDIVNVSNNVSSGTKDIYKTLKGKVEKTEAYKKTKKYYDTKIKELEDKEQIYEKAISSLPEEKQAKARKNLKKIRIKIAKEKRKAEKVLSDISKETLTKKVSDTVDSGFKTVKEDFKYTKLKGKVKKVIDKDKKEDDDKVKKSDSETARLSSAINSLVSFLKPKKKKEVLGDSDGDGKKDNSWWSILNRKKKEKKEKVVKKEKKNNTIFGGALKSLGLSVIPYILTKMFESTVKGFGILGSISKAVGSIAMFFGIGSKSWNIMTLFKDLSWSIGKHMTAATILGSGMISKAIGLVLKGIGLKKLGDVLINAGNKSKDLSKKVVGKKSFLKRLGSFIGRHKGKLLGATALAGLLYSPDANAGDEMDFLKDTNDINKNNKENNIELQQKDDINKNNKENNSDSGGSVIENIGYMLAGNYAIDKTIDLVKKPFTKKKDKVSQSDVNKAKTSVNQLRSWVGDKTKYLRKPSMVKKMAKMGLKKIPGIGLAVSLVDGVAQLAKGNYKKAGLGILSGALAMIPFLGTVASLGVDAYAETIDEPKQEHHVQENKVGRPRNDLSNIKYKSAQTGHSSRRQHKDIKHEVINKHLDRRHRRHHTVKQKKEEINYKLKAAIKADEAARNKKDDKSELLKKQYFNILKDKDVTYKTTGRTTLFYKKNKKGKEELLGSASVNADNELYINIAKGKYKGNSFIYKEDKNKNMKPENGAKPLPKLSQKEITKGDKYLFEFISKHESKVGNAGYEILVRNIKLKGLDKITDKTINQIYAIQRTLVNVKKTSGAIGKYQFIPMTLKDIMKRIRKHRDLPIDNKTIFSPLTQDLLIKYRLVHYRRYHKWKKGEVTDVEFANNLANEFASIKPPGKDHGNYDNDGRNKATVEGSDVLKVLQKVRELDNTVSHPENDEKIEKVLNKKDKSKEIQTTKSKSSGLLVEGLKNAIKMIEEFFGTSFKPTVTRNIAHKEVEDAEGKPTVNTQSTNGNLNNVQVDLPSGVEYELCGIKANRLPALAFGKAVALAGNRHFKDGKPKFLMVHNTAGPNLYLGRMKKDGYGTQIWIDKSGKVTVIGDITQIYYHVGRLRPEWYGKVSSLNTIGIEMVCNYKNGRWEEYTKAQIDSLLKVGKCLMMKFGIPKEHVLYHYQTSYKTEGEGKIGAMLLKGIDMTGPNEEPNSVKGTSANGADSIMSISSSPIGKKTISKELSDAEGMSVANKSVFNKNIKNKNNPYSFNSVYSLDNSKQIIDSETGMVNYNKEIVDLGHKRLSTLENIESYLKQMAEKESPEVHHHYNEKKEIVKTEVAKEKKKNNKFEVIKNDKPPSIKLSS